MKNRTKLCPLLDRSCEKKKCSLHYEPCDACVIQLLAYNTYKLNLLGQEHFANNEDTD